MNKYIVDKEFQLPLTDGMCLESVSIKRGEIWEETGKEPTAWSARKCRVVLRRLSDGHESEFNKMLIGDCLKPYGYKE